MTVLKPGGLPLLICCWCGERELQLTGRKMDADRGPLVSALLLVSRTQVRNFPEPQPAPADPVEFEDFKRTQAALIRSRLVLNAALNMKGVGQQPTVKAQADPIGWLAAHVRVDFPDNGEVMRVGLDGDDVEELKVLVNAVTDAYFQEVVNKTLAARRWPRRLPRRCTGHPRWA